MTRTRTELPGLYARAVDERDVPAVAALFAPDATFTLPPALTGATEPTTLSGAVAIAEAVVEAVSPLIATRHEVFQQVIDGTTGVTYCTAHHLYTRDERVRDNRIALRYHDRFTDTGGSWVFASRALAVDFAEDVPVRLPS
ncbi:nuclear transport factor 2 family protein [Rhodococcus triatomae]|uniref:SnoaL-like domain-containing protein n=1 Tax=Rhodococcus triatomae TaxID=300028 RepID=A0A1G7ZUM5_9NOCA|nr:nuclear transport factor 2 family protein [Rhodococcus triatomae]QNG17944.1 nuclear transport factor 2 family protein [Rhodococcus triatomae]QNG22387.1 nuclear transport factor 2 family protein [Rhodococcus triatomae]SDH12307.1 SnoaL-like domain-containing protein [Rhodococcus triatomae]